MLRLPVCLGMNSHLLVLQFMSADNFCTSETFALLDCRIELDKLIALHRINNQA